MNLNSSACRAGAQILSHSAFLLGLHLGLGSNSTPGGSSSWVYEHDALSGPFWNPDEMFALLNGLCLLEVTKALGIATGIQWLPSHTAEGGREEDGYDTNARSLQTTAYYHPGAASPVLMGNLPVGQCGVMTE